MIQLPLVSVLMPAYNHERFVEEAVKSVWDQTYKNIELIEIDNVGHNWHAAGGEFSREVEKITSGNIA